MVSYGSVTMLTQHGKCIMSFRGCAAQTAAVILGAALSSQNRHGSAVIAADAVQGLVADRYQWLPAFGGHMLVGPIASRLNLLGDPDGAPLLSALLHVFATPKPLRILGEEFCFSLATLCQSPWK